MAAGSSKIPSNPIMDRFLNKRPRTSTNDTFSPTPIEFNPEDLISDPGLRIPIGNYDANIRDQVRRAYLIKGPYQPSNVSFPKNGIEKGNRSFQMHWYKDFHWLEYSVVKDEAYCLWCYLFKPNRADNFGSTVFSTTGFNNWRKALTKFESHIGSVGSSHNEAKQKCQALKNQRQSVSHILSAHGHEMESDYRTRLTAVLDVIRLILHQGFAFRGHDESSTSLNKGNFLQILEFHCAKNEEVAKVSLGNAPKNNQLTSPKVIAIIAREMDDRFTEGNTELLLCMSCLDPRNAFSSFDRAKLLRLSQFYPEDFSEMDRELLINQLNNFIFDMRNDTSLSELQDIRELAIKMVATNRQLTYPLVYRLIELALVLPVATATVERVFSALKIIKTDLRNKIGDQYLNDSMIVYVEKEVFVGIDNEPILQRYQKLFKRRIQLSVV